MSRRQIATAEQKFRKHMPGEPPTNGCWPWTGATNTKGYGHFGVGPRTAYITVYAHRTSYEIFIGPVPDGVMVRHSCDNPICCQPHHLLLGTAAENSRDMTQRGRQQTGTQRWNAKLADDDIREIRALRATGQTHNAIATRFGVNRKTVSAILRNQTWRHVV